MDIKTTHYKTGRIIKIKLILQIVLHVTCISIVLSDIQKTSFAKYTPPPRLPHPKCFILNFKKFAICDHFENKNRQTIRERKRNSVVNETQYILHSKFNNISKGMKATNRNIADSVWWSLLMGNNKNAYYCARRITHHNVLYGAIIN